METEEGAGSWPSHCVWTQVKGKHATLLKVTGTHKGETVQGRTGVRRIFYLEFELNFSYLLYVAALTRQFSLDWQTSAFLSVSLRRRLTDNNPVSTKLEA